MVHRINECDERKGTTTVNNQIGNANIVADHTVFISSWLKELYRTQEIRTEHCSVIMNGADSKIFNNTSYSTWNKDTPLKVVTHHWGGNWLKGFDVYEALDKQLNDKNTRKKFEFTFIGNIPKGFSFKNSRYITPLGGLELSKELQRHHVYLTASQFEPAGMHHIEGAMCGLPLLYRNTGGAIPEYCRNFGIEFNEQNFFEKLHEMAEMYDYYTVRMKDYPYTAEKMCHEYLELFNYMNKNREEFLHARIWQKKPLWLMKNLLIGDII